MKLQAILLTTPVWLTRGWTLTPRSGLCISEPLMALDAGFSKVSASINDDQSHRCEASLEFSNSDFLSLSYSFQPLNCSASQVMTFMLPPEVPNGEAFVTWHCSGLTPLCYHANISGGLEQPEMQLQRTGIVGCVTEVVQTSTGVFTTTASSGVSTESVVTIFTTTQTHYVTQAAGPLAPTTVTQTVVGTPTGTQRDLSTEVMIDTTGGTSTVSGKFGAAAATTMGTTTSATLVPSIDATRPSSLPVQVSTTLLPSTR
ncbi:hypothetical protein BKA67DRAFT_217828 [Truncatella angustata]|uniref:Uncharacterized protein n=1 Tax=Truncatella angustata TaxID=152316 RepID=A0A9P8UV41_9PEZI|nr:uncharacterized protein BKA67DRAFT_217828 [Truncatella angustata]KAH6658612.1 hypothetical protein BKA67DRAFT_217828 [Truncatella angustata]